MASKDLRTRVLVDTKSAERNLNNLIKRINAVDKAMQQIGRQGGNQLSEQLRRSTVQAQQLRNAMNGVTGATRNATSATRQQGDAVGLLTQKVRRLASAYMGIQGARLMLNTSDQITGAQNKLNYMNAKATGDTGEGGYSKATLNETTKQMDKMYQSAQKVRTSYSGMISNVSKSMMLAGKAFNNNIDNAIRFQEIMSEAYTISGASQAEQNSSMYQMIQALGAGVLQGDELRSVREGAQLAYQAIEQFAQGVYNSTDSLKDMASQGKITSDIVIAAILNAGDEMDAAFSRSAMTFEQAFTMIQNAAVNAMRPVQAALNEILNSEAIRKMISSMSELIVHAGVAAANIVHIFGVAINYIAEQWYWMKYIVNGVFAFILIIATIVAFKSVSAILKIFSALVIIPKPLLIIVSMLMLVYSGFALMEGKALETSQVVSIAIMAIGVAVMFLMHNIIGFVLGIVLIIIGCVVMVTGSVSEAAGAIMGVIYTVVSFMANMGQLIVAIFATFFTVIVGLAMNASFGIINAFIKVGTVLSNLGKNIKEIFAAAFSYAESKGWAFANNIASAMLKVANLINSVVGVFGIHVDTSFFEGLVKTTASKYQSASSTASSTASDVASSLLDGYKGLDYVNISKGIDKSTKLLGTPFETGWSSTAYNNGYNVGTSAVSAISDKLSGLTSGLSGATNGITGLNTDLNNLLGNAGNPLGGGTGGSGGSGGKGGNTNKALDKILDNTDKMLDTMNLSEDDLKKLYELAELEWKKDFTTNRITINMTNNNNVNGAEGDLNGLVTKLTDQLYQELNTAAAGVY